MDNFSLLRTKLPCLKTPHHSPINIPGDDVKMIENQNEREDWNDRWLMQLIVWKAEQDALIDEVLALQAMIDLAISQIKHDPPE